MIHQVDLGKLDQSWEFTYMLCLNSNPFRTLHLARLPLFFSLFSFLFLWFVSFLSYLYFSWPLWGDAVCSFSSLVLTSYIALFQIEDFMHWNLCKENSLFSSCGVWNDLEYNLSMPIIWSQACCSDRTIGNVLVVPSGWGIRKDSAAL